MLMHQRVRVCEEIAAKVIDDEAIIINLANGVYYSMDNAAGLVWQMLERGHSLKEVIASVIARYEIPAKQACADVTRLVEELVQEKVVVVSSRVAPPEVKNGNGVERVSRLPYETPKLNIYRDMGDLLALDPPTPELDTPWKDPDKSSQ